MIKRSKGFTLIELLIVVAIIGILAALLIPNAMTAMQRARQKGTMKDISTIATYLMDYTSDRGSAPAWSGTYTRAETETMGLVPFYAKAIPLNDQWGNDFEIHSGSSWTTAFCGMTPATDSTDEFAVGSPGRNTTYTFDFDSTGASFYSMTEMSDYDNDLVSWNGQFVCRPSTTSGT